MTDPHDYLREIEGVAAAADAQQDEIDRIEGFQVDVADWVARLAYIQSQMVGAGVFDPATIQQSVAAIGPAQWAEIQRERYLKVQR